MARYQGRLIEWHDEQGYGFIQGITDPRHNRLFLHIKSFSQHGPRPIQGCVIEYDLGLDQKSRPQAINVRYVKAKQVQKTQSSTSNQMKKSTSFHPIFIVMAIYWVGLLVMSAFGQLIPLSLLMIMLINAYTYWIYYQDKQAAIQNQARVAEQHLLLMSALGGWTAAWFAAQHFRHKTQKQPFKTYFALSIVINFVLIAFSVWVQRLYF
ncbi:DUF1294 domain-containing protein [Acinetobacter qingfengensis]|uniref:Uncharacterized protein n=1 Tax=Acinetobacter qingfengensis TaxID=1262585 RepID=A0A1E7R380_9GAMM|nr:DUF1294 domain-containing protein [Acinetobacter qingfengensis]KAA8733776.1 DUF1294 domain-containing protein [Acinetobacter qingfengensis]OEY93713.1 hypothetical protein BJI46_04520 [Acinetobacter qingfengensis]